MPATLHSRRRFRAACGFTLLELLMVVALIATCSALVTLALPNPDHSALERDGQRLASLLDSARAKSRGSGRPVTWRPTADGFSFDGLPNSSDNSQGQPQATMRWLDPDVHLANGPSSIQLGPEPMLQPQQLTLARGGQQLQVRTDGLRPFAVVMMP